MLSSSYAVVVKNKFPHKCTAVLLTQRFGKIHVMFRPKDALALCANGAIVQVHITQKNARVFTVEQLHVVQSPGYTHIEQLVFMHDVLRIVLYGLPFGVVASDVFDHITALQAGFVDDEIEQKRYILKLFYLLGIFVEDRSVYACIMGSRQACVPDVVKRLDRTLHDCWMMYEEQKYSEISS